MAKKKDTTPKWEDGTPKSMNNAFNWRAVDGQESLMGRDPATKAKSTLAKSKASGKVAIDPPRQRITLRGAYKK